VLADRLRELIGTHPNPRMLEGVPQLAGCSRSPLDWNDYDARSFERARGELGMWSTQAGLDRAAERAAEKIAIVFSAGDNGDAKPPALSAGVEAIDENDAALLAFLNRHPSLRRMIADVLPDKGPQDRKAVARRMRKLADRTPALVDYPKDGRSGVAILPAGVEALKRATAPMPR